MIEARIGALAVLVALALAIGAIASVAHAAEDFERQSQPLTEPYQPPVTTVLASRGVPQATVLLPEDPAYVPVAEEFVSEFEARTGVQLPTATESGVAAQKPPTPTLVVCGNFATGPVALRLYANKLICSDGVYPGPSGYELRTIPDALDFGANILFIGGSTPGGARAAMAAFLPELKRGEDVAVPRLIDWSCPTQSTPGSVTDAEIADQVAAVQAALRAFQADPFRTAAGRLGPAATNYYLSGDDSWGRLYARVVEVLADHYARERPDPPTFIMHDLVMGLDQVDDSAGMDDSHRLIAAEWVRQMVDDTMSFWEMGDPIRRWENDERRPVWNHETYPCLGIAHAAQYLRTRYRVPAARYWEAVVDNLFAGQVQCDQPLEDSANYQWSVPRHTAAYVLATGRLHEYLTGGALRECLEYTIASHDNQGNEATHGDAWQPFGSTAGGLLAIATAQYHDPRYQWMRERIGVNETPGLWSFAGAMEAETPDDHIGLRVFSVDPARVDAYGIEGIPPQRVLDKAVFRSGWDRTDQYLMLDGLNVGNHKHLDANAIIRFADNRRLWLVDMDYIRAAPKYHNSIAVVRDGRAPDQRPASRRDAQVIAEPPFAAELIHAAGSADRAMTQSLLPDYGGLDWRRSLFWEAEEFLVVIDELQARTEGDYVTRCFWRTLGEAELDGPTLHVKQAGEHRTGNDLLRVLDDAGRTVVEFLKPSAQITFGRDLTPGSYGVQLIARGVNGGADSLWLQVDEGERLAYHLPLENYGASAGTYEKTTPGPEVAINAAGEHRFRITLREAPGVRLDKVVLTPPGGDPIVLEAENLVAGQVDVIDEPEQHFLIANADGSRLRLTESFDYGHGGDEGYYARYPYADKITRVLVQTKEQHLAAGESLTYANLLYVRRAAQDPTRELRLLEDRASMVTGGQPALAALGAHELPGLEIDAGMFVLTPGHLKAAAARRIALLGAEWRAEQSVDLDVTLGGGPVSPEAERERAAGLAALDVGDVRGLLERLARDSTAPPAATPRHKPEAAPISLLWETDLGSQVTALAAAEPGILRGTEQGRVALLDPDGGTVWEHQAGSRVRCVALAREEGSWLCVAGTAAGEVQALDAADGKVRWTYTCQPFHGRSGSVGTVFPADLSGDGRHELVAGSDNSHYHALSATGELLWRTETVHASTVGCAGDLDGDGRDDIVAGTEYYWPRLLDPTGKLMQRMSGGPVTTTVGAFDVDGDGKAEALVGMDDGFLRCVSGGKSTVWQANVGGSPTAVRPFDADGDGKGEVACSSESFSVYMLAGDGSEIWRTQLPEVVNDLAVVGSHLAAACEDGAIYLLDGRGDIVGMRDLGRSPTRVAALQDRHIAVAAGSAIAVLSPVPPR